MNSDLLASIGRILDRIDVRVSKAGVGCLVPMDTALYEEEGLERDDFLQALSIALRDMGFVFDKVYAIDAMSYARLVYTRPCPVRRRKISNRRARVIDQRVVRGVSVFGKKGGPR